MLDVQLTSFFKKSAEEQVLCSGQAARKRKQVNSSMAVYWNSCSSKSAMYFRGTTFTSTSLPWIGHLLVGLGFVGVFLCILQEHPQLPHNPEQALRAAGIAPLPYPVPQFYHSKGWITAAHVLDQLEFCLCVLIGMAVRPSGLTDQRTDHPVPAGLPEVNI